MIRLRLRTTTFYLLFFCSGGAALGYQMAWSRMFTTGLGHEMPAVLAVVCAFMGGMTLGAWTLDGAVSRSPRPGSWYGLLEILVGLWGFLSVALIPLANTVALRLIGLEPSPLRHWSVAFALPFVSLLPATAAMGATLPAMERFLASLKANARCVGALYAANTLGAMAGVLVTTFVIAPALGFQHTLWLLATINLLCGAAALLLGTRTDEPVRAASANAASAGADTLDCAGSVISTPERAGSVSKYRLAVTVCVTGLLGIGYEAVGVRVLSQVLENTVYTFAAVLSVYLLGTSIGAALYQRLGLRVNSRLLLTDLLGGISLTCVLGLLVMSQAQPFYDSCRATLGDNELAVLAAEMAVAGAVFVLPTLFMGATFSHLVQAARRKEGGVGQAAALNTFGGALASALFGVLLLPATGSKWALVLISLGYLLLLPKVAGWRWGIFALPVALLFTLPANLQLVQVPPGGKAVEYREGVMASVAVVEEATHHRVLRVDNRFQMGGTAAADAEYRHAHIPLLLHPAPKRALVLGLGTGISFGAAGRHPGVRSDGVELVPEVVEVMSEFEPYNFSPTKHPRLKVFVADARRFVRATAARYDVIVADLFHPARDGAGLLYTREHFHAIQQRLEPGGLFCQWLPLHQLDEPMLRVIVRTFLEVFPETHAYLLRFNVDAPVLGLVGFRDEAPRYSSQWVEARLDAPELEAQLKRLALADSIRLFGCLVAGPEALRDFAGSAPLNSDDHPRVTFGAPRFTYRRDATSYGRLLAMLKLDGANPRETLKLGSDAGADRFAGRLSRYIVARDVYLKGLIEEAEGRNVRAIDAFVESARLSEDFTSGYAQCLTIALLQAKTRPDEARALLQRLVEAQPSRPVAREMLQRLFGK